MELSVSRLNPKATPIEIEDLMERDVIHPVARKGHPGVMPSVETADEDDICGVSLPKIIGIERVGGAIAFSADTQSTDASRLASYWDRDEIGNVMPS